MFLIEKYKKMPCYNVENIGKVENWANLILPVICGNCL